MSLLLSRINNHMNTVCQDLLNTIENKWRVVLEDGSDITYWRISFYREKISFRWDLSYGRNLEDIIYLKIKNLF